MPFSVLQAETQAVQPLAHLVVSTSMPQRWSLEAGSPAGRACATCIRCTPGATATSPSPADAARKPRRSLLLMA